MELVLQWAVPMPHLLRDTVFPDLVLPVMEVKLRKVEQEPPLYKDQAPVPPSMDPAPPPQSSASSVTPNLSCSSGHGSDFSGVPSSAPGSGAYSRVPTHRASVSGSPSDYCSSDEYGSSPGDHTLMPSPSLPGSSVGSVGSQSLGDEGANYILMGQRGAESGSANQGSLTNSPKPVPGTPGSSAQSQSRRVLRRSSSRESEAERRLLSKRASLPPMALERLAPRQRRAEEPTDEESADYAIMSRSTSRESFTSTSSTQRQSVAGGSGYLDVASEFKTEGGGGNIDLGVDNGYMSMLPGVTQPQASVSQSMTVSVPEMDSKPADDYMAMTPNNSVSPPQQIRPPTSDGYMIMSPNSSCSPDQRGGLSGGLGARSINGSPPPPDHTGHLENSSHQQTPKMVYSYYSLPRSYKHNPSGHFDDGPGRGRRSSASRGMGGGRAAAGRQEQTSTGNSASGRHLSLSSSSYSSSSASSESLGESEERPPLGASSKAAASHLKDGNKPPQKQTSNGLSKQGSHTKSRPVSLFVDISKANTLPRVRENPLPQNPRVPGNMSALSLRERKAARFGLEEVVGGVSDMVNLYPIVAVPSKPRTDPCLVWVTLSLSPAAHQPHHPAYRFRVCQHGLRPSPSPSPHSHTPLVFPSFHSPPTPPALALAPKTSKEGTSSLHEERVEVAEPQRRKSREKAPSVTESESPTSCSDYTEMAFSLTSNSTATSVSPQAPSPNRTDPTVPVLSCGLDFPLAKGPNPDHGAKVIRADPQGRRRHCSETFLAPVPTTTSSSTSSTSTATLFPEHAQAVVRRLGFEGMLWGNGAVTDPPSQPLPINNQTSSAEQGLNYIDLDLASKEGPIRAWTHPRAARPPLGSSPCSPGAVASARSGHRSGAVTVPVLTHTQALTSTNLKSCEHKVEAKREQVREA
ncbi:hypothetical protein WMY93_014493 [Mugilogobius chulae]|uniref:Uncharacterized protein n=1 Tax=Mugilogobius chulae TaxID=88201 RepID=A0AAW0NVP6_9GOBI